MEGKEPVAFFFLPLVSGSLAAPLLCLAHPNIYSRPIPYLYHCAACSPFLGGRPTVRASRGGPPCAPRTCRGFFLSPMPPHAAGPPESISLCPSSAFCWLQVIPPRARRFWARPFRARWRPALSLSAVPLCRRPLRRRLEGRRVRNTVAVNGTRADRTVLGARRSASGSSAHRRTRSCARFACFARQRLRTLRIRSSPRAARHPSLAGRIHPWWCIEKRRGEQSGGRREGN